MTFLRNTAIAKTSLKIMCSSLLRTYILKIFSESSMVGPIVASGFKKMLHKLSVNSAGKISNMQGHSFTKFFGGFKRLP